LKIAAENVYFTLKDHRRSSQYSLGHYHSPVPDPDYIRRRENEIWPQLPEFLQGIDLNVKEQLQYLDSFKHYYDMMPFQETKNDRLRYHFENGFYTYSDAIALYSMIRKLRPKRIIEIGSGYSSCVMMDTNELFFNDEIEITFIEPHPDRLISLMKKDDLTKYKIIRQEIQTVEMPFFNTLKENDILFVDSSHISKIGSDVNHIIFNVLPLLNNGVHIHFHDIFYPLEYPKKWIYQGTCWNETYLLRAFLQYNNLFNIVFFNTYLECFYKDIFENHMPLCLRDAVDGTSVHGSIWLKHVRLNQKVEWPDNIPLAERSA